MRILYLIISISILLAVSIRAENTLIERIDTKPSGEISHTLGLLTPKCETWVLSLNKSPIIEAGKLFPLHKNDSQLLLGGYISYWSKSNDWYLEPYVIFRKDYGNLRVKAKGLLYIPIRGENWAIGSDEFSCTHTIKSARIGLVAKLWKDENKPIRSTYGYILEIPTDKTNLIIRYTPYGDYSSFRLQMTKTF